MSKLEGKVALVTGASRGIGKTIALRLARDGAKVVVNYVNSSKAAEDVVAEIKSNGGDAIALQGDIQNVSEIRALIAESFKHFGKVDILVNNAGIVHYKLLEEHTEETYEQIFGTNVRATYFAIQEVVKAGMSRGGRIINLSSTTTAIQMPRYSLYAASKAAVENITKHLATELGPKGININAVSPGPTDTELFRKGKDEETIERMKKMAPLYGLGTPGDIAGVVAFLCSEDAKWITGQNIKVNGGLAS
ncbi:short-chain dehydrogenase/reductase SDR [Basidiobolus meristosporus CBS 931.73]|uniref:Short-chain dehydrogenase/reductase SDR n=1 Tax=Basidiobolus meristosporus CBS 931.73 TaxID=1314790 RepID=A0A1Y1X0J3_9FUNG|nr:short-chain dehydrogenase/reductase SDR [Basidiobolus meristosporus CBS 931.73]|eukprot:ORX78946.1 short-chain dehydrogenase/reductase SDR [Basidiobolus meristosporus CBS 931.73]